MARYIDADALKTAILKKYRGNWEIPCSSEDRLIQRVVTDLRVLIEQSITADVVPKSEVENLKVLLEMKENAYEGLRELYHTDTDALVEARRKTEVEVAREIITEIADFIWQGESEKMNFPFDNRYYNKQEFIAELKKKYTGEVDGNG